jgi:aryl-alcohol dehydrogenase-like predicted oxidoreductase
VGTRRLLDELRAVTRRATPLDDVVKALGCIPSGPEDETLLREILEADACPAGEPMVRREHCAQPLLNEDLVRELRLRPASAEEAEVEPAVEHSGERGFVDRLLEPEHDRREGLLEGAHDLRQQRVRRRGKERNCHLAFLAATDALRVAQHALVLAEQSRETVAERRTGRCEPHLSTGSGEELDAERPLEIANRPRQRRLRHVEPLRRTAEVQLRCDRLEGAEQPQLDIHAAMIHARMLSLDRDPVLSSIDRAFYGDRMDTRTLTNGLEVSALGYGAMGLIGLYGDVGEDDGLAALQHALARGVTFVDTADAYGRDGANERLVARAIAGRRDDVVLATKWGIAPPGPTAHRFEAPYANEIWVDARPERAREALETSLRRLGVDAVDLWYLHFPDPAVPIEDSIGGMAALVEEGKARHLGVSNATADELRRAHEVHPIAAVQTEYSLWTRTPEDELLPTARELGVGVVAWGPLGNGFLAGGVTRLGEADFRHNAPRFQGENLRRNQDRFAPLRELARELDVTPAQLAVAWLLHQGDDVVPIPGSRNSTHIDDNIASVGVRLDDGDLARIDELAPAGLAVGAALV